MYTNENLASQEAYRDLHIRIAPSLLASHIIIAFGEKETFFELLLMRDYYRSLVISTVIGFILVSLVKIFAVKLDKKYPRHRLPIVRTLLQLSFGMVVPSILTFLFASVYFRIFGLDIINTLYLKYDFPGIVLMLVLLNGYYLAHYFYRQWQSAELKSAELLNSEENSKAENSISRETFLVQRGVESIPLPVEAIAYFYRVGAYYYLNTFDQEWHMESQTLDDLEARLDKVYFFEQTGSLSFSIGPAHTSPPSNSASWNYLLYLLPGDYRNQSKNGKNLQGIDA